MQHIFIVNPAAGKGKAKARIVPEIEAYFAAHPQLSYEIYVTTEAGDGQRFVAERAQTGAPVRFYACGGDGTPYEVVNGAYKYPNAQVAIIPLGSGNDLVRILGKSDTLYHIGAQVVGEPSCFDLIRPGLRAAVNW